MNRRELIQKFAAIAAAVTVAPALEAEAAPVQSITLGPAWQWPGGFAYRGLRQPAGAITEIDLPLTFEAMPRYTALYPKTDEVWYRATPLTFEAMQADCAARGCRLETLDTIKGSRLVHHQGEEAYWQHYASDQVFTTSTDLARVDAWRTGLHA